MKKWVSLLFVAALMLFMNVGWTSAAAKQTTSETAKVPKLYLDGKALTAKVPPALVHSSVLVPIRTVAESLGYKVGYDTKKKQVSVKEGSTTILMTLNNPKATVNGRTVTMTEPPMLQSDTTLIPLRFVGETFGLQILWDNDSKSVFLFSDTATDGNGNGGSNSGGGTTEPETGTDPGAGTGTGSLPEPTPSDGGLIGVVDGPNGDGETDGGSGGSVDPGGGVTPAPALTAHLHQIRYESDAVVITYEGSASPVPNVLKGPDRIVIDLPNADYAEDFSAGVSSGAGADFIPSLTGIPYGGNIVEFAVAGHEALTKIRYAQYQNTPKIARVVLDLNQTMAYDLLNDTAAGEIRILLRKPLQQPEPVKKGYTVVLDAGHGGSDPGARSITGKWEKDFNLSVVKKIQAILANESKINLVLTRHADTYPSLDDRVNLANNLKADLFLSVHGNSWKSGINGTETYYTRSKSLDFAKLLHRNAVAATGFKDNGVRNAGYKVIKYTTMPAVLLEVGYLSYGPNEKAMYNDDFQNRIAAAIALSIKQYLKLS